MSNLLYFLKNNLSMRHIRLLIALDTHRSVGKAATYLNLTQPAISKSLATIEEGVGTPLFRRGRNGLVPTEAGVCLTKHARRIALRIEIAERELDEIMVSGYSHVSIGTLPTTAVYLIPRMIARLEAASSRTTVSLREGTMDSLLPALRTGAIDLAVGLLSTSLGPEFESEILLADPVVATVRRGHPLGGKARLEWKELEGFPLVLPNPWTFGRGAIEALLMNRRVDVTRNRVDSVSTMANVGILQVTDSVGFMSRSLVEHFRALGVLEILPLEIPAEVVLNIGIVWIADRDRTDAHLLAHQFLVSAAQELSVEPMKRVPIT